MEALFTFVTILIALITLFNRFARSTLLYNSYLARLRPVPKEKLPTKKFQPKVAIHVATSNEDPHIVLETLNTLLALDYSNYIVMVIDNNTVDESDWLPIRDFCAEYPDILIFFHVEQLDGFKAGALDYVLERTPLDIELIAIVDADVSVKSDFLKVSTPYFEDKNIVVVQSPLGFKVDPTSSKFQSWIFLIYRYYLSVFMSATDRYHCAPFIGAMGVLRRKTLEVVGGWKKIYLTEDMELSYRLFSRGYCSIYIEEPHGFSMPPSDLHNFKKQHFRWNFGNTQIIRDYLRIGSNHKWRGSSPGIRKFLFFSCQGIYFNIYYLPYVILIILFGFLEETQGLGGISMITSMIIVGTLLIDLIGEIIYFVILGVYEKVSFIYVLKNMVSWYALSFNNSWSTWNAFFRKTTKFHITDKGRKIERSQEKFPIMEGMIALSMLMIVLQQLNSTPIVIIVLNATILGTYCLFPIFLYLINFQKER